MATNFHLAPPAKMVDGLLAVPIDIESIDAHFNFDGSTQSASADATINYTVGPTAGNPIFDLRQEITQAWLDGAPWPVSQLAHHNFGAEPFTNLRVIEAVQGAGSVHTLRVQYSLALPNAQLGGSYLPALAWSPGPKLTFVFGFSDLNRARYAEAWLPANLVFDQFSINLEFRILNTIVAHAVITNGVLTTIGLNHWQINFPARSSAVSPMLEVRPADTLVRQTDSTVLPVSGKTVSIEAWKPAASPENLTTQINNIKSLLAENENEYGAYVHDDRYVAFFNGAGGMEYDGGTTTSAGALGHEIFHSWFARGVKPASQADGWWDEGFTRFYDDGADDLQPFDFAEPSILLCSRDSWQRHTPGNAYNDGSRFWRGMAALLGLATFKALMADLYEIHKGNPLSTQMIEEFLLSRSGNAQVVNAFHRFVYGLENPSPAPDLWLMDDPAHVGADQWDGAFWDSPDLWIRNADDGGTDHQVPEVGQDNWFHACVRNKAGAGVAQHFVVTFHAQGFAGTQFAYPADFLPCLAAKAEFDLAPGETRVVKARWPREFVPATGSHSCLLASVITLSDHPGAGRHVWEDNNLAQKNLTIIDLLPDSFMILPVVIANWRGDLGANFDLELWQPQRPAGVSLSLIHRSQEFFRHATAEVREFQPAFTRSSALLEQVVLECGGHLHLAAGVERGRVITSETPDLLLRRFANSWEAPLAEDSEGRLAVEIPPFTQTVVGLKIALAADVVERAQSFKVHLVQRQAATQQIVGGIAVQVNIGDGGS